MREMKRHLICACKCKIFNKFINQNNAGKQTTAPKSVCVQRHHYQSSGWGYTSSWQCSAKCNAASMRLSGANQACLPMNFIGREKRKGIPPLPPTTATSPLTESIIGEFYVLCMYARDGLEDDEMEKEIISLSLSLSEIERGGDPSVCSPRPHCQFLFMSAYAHLSAISCLSVFHALLSCTFVVVECNATGLESEYHAAGTS